MALFNNLATDDSIQEETDTLGGSRIWDSGVYDTVIDMAYVDASKGGAMSLNYTFKTQNGRSLKLTEWVTSGDAKGNLNYYVDKSGNKKYLPGFNTANAIALLSVGSELSELEPEEKTINIFDFDQKKEVPTKRQVVVDLIGKEITLGVIKQTVNKNVKNDDGVYVPSSETRDENIIDKVFRTEDHMTVTEIRAEAEEAAFYDKWSEKNTGVTRNKVREVAGAPTAGASTKPKQSLFKK